MRKRHAGTTTVEFAIIASLFFLVLFGVLEFGRLLFVWNTLTESTRRGARVAVVCPVQNPPHPAIANISVFDSPAGGGASPILPGLTTANVVVEYLDQNGNSVPNYADPANFLSIRYIRVSIVNYLHDMLIPFFTATLNSPNFTTTLPRESLGIIPVDPDEVAPPPQCFGIT